MVSICQDGSDRARLSPLWSSRRRRRSPDRAWEQLYWQVRSFSEPFSGRAGLIGHQVVPVSSEARCSWMRSRTMRTMNARRHTMQASNILRSSYQRCAHRICG